MEKFIFEYKNFILAEPNMLLSNWVITIVCLICLFRLRKVPSLALIHFYRLVFIMNGIGAFFGGLAHFFYHYGGTAFQAFAWIFIMTGTYALQRIAIFLVRKPKLQKVFKIFSMAKLIIFLLALLYLQRFVIVLADLALGLFLIVIPVHIAHYRQTRNTGSWLTLVAIIIIILSAIFPLFRISIHETWFNFNDIGHIFMTVSLYVIYRSAKSLAALPMAH